MTVYAYLFEAKSIQTYILATNRLKEIVGASELIESLTGSLLDEVTTAVGGGLEFSRRGGGAFYVFSNELQVIEKLATLWPLVVRRYAPDLEFVQARGHGTTAREAFDEAHPKLLSARNRAPARLPQAGPFVVRNRRTGEPATGRVRARGRVEPVDAATLRKLDSRFWRGLALGKRFSPDSSWASWPLNLTPEQVEGDDDSADAGSEQQPSRDFPFNGDDRTIALVHADGNGLGQLLMDLWEATRADPTRFAAMFRRFSEAISRATESAAQEATANVLVPAQKGGVFPARPIVLGGDDLTILVRADLALEFTRQFLTNFAKASAQHLEQLKSDFTISQLPDRLTACAGIAYASSSQPFYLLHGLAEGLCKHAKERAKAARASAAEEVPAALSFHRVTTALVDRYATILKRELTAGALRQTLECYGLEPHGALPSLDGLLSLQRLLDDPLLSRGSTRELLGLVGREPGQAVRHYARWREVMGDKRKEKLDQFDGLLLSLGVSHPGGDLPFGTDTGGGLRRSPLGDVVTLRSVGNEAGADAVRRAVESIA